MDKRTLLVTVALMVSAVGALMNLMSFHLVDAVLFLGLAVLNGWALWLRMQKGRR
jgi:hypothetical protein